MAGGDDGEKRVCVGRERARPHVTRRTFVTPDMQRAVRASGD